MRALRSSVPALPVRQAGNGGIRRRLLVAAIVALLDDIGSHFPLVARPTPVPQRGTRSCHDATVHLPAEMIAAGSTKRISVPVRSTVELGHEPGEASRRRPGLSLYRVRPGILLRSSRRSSAVSLACAGPIRHDLCRQRATLGACGDSRHIHTTLAVAASSRRKWLELAFRSAKPRTSQSWSGSPEENCPRAPAFLTTADNFRQVNQFEDGHPSDPFGKVNTSV